MLPRAPKIRQSCFGARKSGRLGVLGAVAALSLAACGGGSGGGNGGDVPSPVNTLAYVISDCHLTDDGVYGSQTLWTLENGTKHKIVKFQDYGTVVGLFCRETELVRYGEALVLAGVLQRLGVSPSGDLVAFEVTAQHAARGNPQIPPEAEGTFLVRSDGTGLRRIGPASREAAWRVINGGFYSMVPLIRFSPDERLITFTDLGPGPDGEEAAQIFVQDIESGARTQLTRLPVLDPLVPYQPAISPPFFVDEETIGFITGEKSEGYVAYTVRLDGMANVTRLPPPLSSRGARIGSTFVITDADKSVFTANFPADGSFFPGIVVLEIMATDGPRTVQLTNFGRFDTGWESNKVGPVIVDDRVYFTASTNELGTNPGEVCQLFSMSVNGGDLWQLTHFEGAGLPPGGRTYVGCLIDFAPSCYAAILGHDEKRGKILLHSSCDPSGSSETPSQVFAIDLDGSNLEQLTDARGRYTDDLGFWHVELTGQQAYAQGR